MKTCNASSGDFMTLFFGMALTLIKTSLSGTRKNGFILCQIDLQVPL
jgi:hypothetical protein